MFPNCQLPTPNTVRTKGLVRTCTRRTVEGETMASLGSDEIFRLQLASSRLPGTWSQTHANTRIQSKAELFKDLQSFLTVFISDFYS